MHVLTIENTNLRKEITKIPSFLSQDSSIPDSERDSGEPGGGRVGPGAYLLAEPCAS